MFTKVTGVATRLYVRVANLRSLQLGFMQFFTLSIFVQGFWYGNHIVKSGRKDVGQVITTFWAALIAIQGIAGFLPQFIVLQKGRIAGATLHRLVTQISANDQNHESEGHLKPIKCPGDIEFRQVHSYVLPTDANADYPRSLSHTLHDQRRLRSVTSRYSSPLEKQHLFLGKVVQAKVPWANSSLDFISLPRVRFCWTVLRSTR